MRSLAMRVAAILLSATAATRAQDDGPAYPVANINRTVDSRAGSYAAGFTTAGTHLYFVADDGTHDYQLWRTDRPPRGAERTTEDVVQSWEYPRYLTPIGTDLYFLTDGLQRIGPEPGEKAVLIEPGRIIWLRRVGDLLLFARDGRLWTTDGRPGAARDVAALPDDEWAYQMTKAVAGDQLILLSCRWQVGCLIWRSDGTPEGSGQVPLVGDTFEGLGNGELPLEHIEMGGVLYFLGRTEAAGVELWRTDGTDEGTALIADIAPGRAGSEPRQPIRLGDAVLFVADDGGHGLELWSTDGATAGTRLVRDIHPGNAGSDPDRFAVVGDQVFFFADDGTHGRELWRSNGTTAGTSLVRDLRPGTDGGDLSSPGVTNQVRWRGACSFSPTTDAAGARSGVVTARPAGRGSSATSVASPTLSS